jgi:hypothetical protein
LETTFAKTVRDWLLSEAPAASFPVVGLWPFGCFFQPTPDERKFVYRIIVAKTTGQGAAYHNGAPPPEEEIAERLGEPFDISTAIFGDPVDFALLDSVANSLARPAVREIELTGSSTTKAVRRASVIADEVDLLATRALGRKRRVCNVGVVSLLIRELSQRGYEVTATDMDPDLIGKSIGSTVVESGLLTPGRIAGADVAVVTGMTLANGTFPDILAAAKAGGTKLVMFCETGSGLAPLLIAEGVSTVVAEPFPFYIFDGRTSIQVHRRGQI